MRYLLDLLRMRDRPHILSQIKAYVKVAADTSKSLHDKLVRNVRCRLKRGSEWLTLSAKTIETCTPLNNVRKDKA